MNQKTPVMLVTGSLGSGKTTLLRRILSDPPFRIAVLMNEFGEVAIDSTIIHGENIDIIELAGGCVCCSMTGEFQAAVREILEKAAPELILVEATGVAESDALVFEVEDNLPEVRLDSVICIIDADVSIRHPHIGYTSRTQITSADLLMINKIDLVTTEDAERVEVQARNYNDHAFVVRTVDCNVDIRLLFGLNPAGGRSRLSKGLPGLEKIQSFFWESGKTLNSEKFESFAGGLPQQVYRAKGFVRFPDGSRLFNYVAGRYDFEPFSAESTVLVFIGRDLDSLRERIMDQLRACED